jgi:Ala-tRNA(Pro) deacylase
MAMAITLQQFMNLHDVDYDVVMHRPTATSSHTAQSSHVPGDQLAKAVVLKHEDGYLLAVLPASHHLHLGSLQKMLDRPVGLATEAEVACLFDDCAEGAVPCVGAAYGLKTMIDESLEDQTDLYFEGGDHESLVHVTEDQFGLLMADAIPGRFSTHD